VREREVCRKKETGTSRNYDLPFLTQFGGNCKNGGKKIISRFTTDGARRRRPAMIAHLFLFFVFSSFSKLLASHLVSNSFLLECYDGVCTWIVVIKAKSHDSL
jgi:hypothetical protein